MSTAPSHPDFVVTVAHGTIFRSRLVALFGALFWPRTSRRWLRVRRTGWELRERSPWLAGGSALRRALNELGDPQLAGLVCLSTPFISARRRDLRDAGEALAWSGGIVVIGLILALTYASPEQWPTRNGWVSLAVGATAVAALVALAAVMRRWAEWAVRQASFPAVVTVPVLTIRAPADEASITLAAAEFLLWTANALWTVPWRTVRAVNEGVLGYFDKARPQPFAREMAHGVITLLVLGSLGWLWWHDGPSADGLVSIVASVVAGAAGLGLVLLGLSFATGYVWGPLLVLLWPVAALCLWPFGGWLAVTAPFVEVNVGWSPPGRSEAVLLTAVDGKGGMAHSASYQDRRALDVLLEWLRRAPTGATAEPSLERGPVARGA